MAKPKKTTLAGSPKPLTDKESDALPLKAAPPVAHRVMVPIGLDKLEALLRAISPEARAAIATLISKVAAIRGLETSSTDIIELYDMMKAQTGGGGVYVDIPSDKLKESVPPKAAASAPISGGSGASWIFGPVADIQRITVIFLKGAFSDSPPLSFDRIPFDYLVTLIHELIHDAPADRMKVFNHDPAGHHNEMEEAAKALGAESLDDYIRKQCVPEQFR